MSSSRKLCGFGIEGWFVSLVGCSFVACSSGWMVSSTCWLSASRSFCSVCAFEVGISADFWFLRWDEPCANVEDVRRYRYVCGDRLRIHVW